MNEIELNNGIRMPRLALAYSRLPINKFAKKA